MFGCRTNGQGEDAVGVTITVAVVVIATTITRSPHKDVTQTTSSLKSYQKENQSKITKVLPDVPPMAMAGQVFSSPFLLIATNSLLGPIFGVAICSDEVAINPCTSEFFKRIDKLFNQFKILLKIY